DLGIRTVRAHQGPIALLVETDTDMARIPRGPQSVPPGLWIETKIKINVPVLGPNSGHLRDFLVQVGVTALKTHRQGPDPPEFEVVDHQLGNVPIDIVWHVPVPFPFPL